jgi:hypothetical protein
MFREPGDEDWLTLVCTSDSTFTITNEITKVRTNCGIQGSPGDPEFSASGNAVQNATPETLQASYQDVKEAQVDGTLLEFQYISAADAPALTEGQGVNNYGLGYFTESTFTANADPGGPSTFSWSFEGIGTLDDFDQS